MSFAPTAAAARTVTGREAGDAERAHYDMVSVRIDIAMHIQALRRVQRQRQVQEAATPQVAETTGPPVSQRVRGGRQTAREDGIDDVDANPEIMSKAPSTPPAAAPPSEEEAENESFEATRAVKKKWQKLFTLAEKWPAQAVTSRLGAVSMLHERARLALVETTRADERVAAARAEMMQADTRETEGAEKTPRGFVAAAAAADRTAVEIETAIPGSTSRDAAKPETEPPVADLARLESFARRARETAFDLNGGLSCLMEAVDSEARAELRMAWEAGAWEETGDGVRGLHPAPLLPAHRLPNQWPLGSAIAFTGAFTGGLTGNATFVPTFAPVVPVAPPVAPVAHSLAADARARRAKKRKPPTPTPAGGRAETKPGKPAMPPVKSPLLAEKTETTPTKEPRRAEFSAQHVRRDPGESGRPPARPMPPGFREDLPERVIRTSSTRADGSVREPIRIRAGYVNPDEVPKYRPGAFRGQNKEAEARGEPLPRRVRREPPGAATCAATTKKTGQPCTFRAVYGAFCARHSDVVRTLPGDKPRPRETGKKRKD
jgi:hypothetical protein